MVLGPFTDVSSADDLSADIAAIDKDSEAGTGSGATYTIDLVAGATLIETDNTAAINLKGGDKLIINGDGATLNGASAYRGLFVYQGAVSIQNLTIGNAVASGGAGGYGGGGGAGLGGGLFIANDAAQGANPGAVTLENVSFVNDSAKGGAGGGVLSGGGGGGGGLGGKGGNGGGPGGGGGGIDADGADAYDGPGQNGLVPGAAGGGAGSTGDLGGLSGGGGGTGGRFGFSDYAGAGGGGGIGGHAGSGDTGGAAGDGGFGGGGGGGGDGYGNGGFGGGGGSALSGGGGNGGFGGGGGELGGPPGSEGKGGFGAGNAGFIIGGGGGLGAGGDIFIQAGASLTIAGGSLDGGAVSAGASGLPAYATAAESGQAFGAGIYMQGSNNVAFDPAAGQTTTVRDVIADDVGAAAAAGYVSPKGYTPGQSGVAMDGAGRLVLTAANTYTGATLVTNGVLEVDNSIASSTVVVTGGMLAGDGVTGAVAVESGGAISGQTSVPGSTYGVLSTGALTLNAGAALVAPISGPYSFSYGQINVTGSVVLGGFLDASLVDGFTASPGQSYTIINNEGDDPVVGTFAGLDQGATTYIGGEAFTISYTGGDGNDVVLTADQPPCYARGTRILTSRGQIEVENLVVGDLAVATDGLRPIRWLGHRRLDISKHPDPCAVWPVRVLRGAFGDAQPSRDLWLSPGHNIAVEGALVPISALINGQSVAQIKQDIVEYWHVELDAHKLLFAEGLLAESYFDCGNRTGFTNGGAFIKAHPDFKAKHWAQTCLPLVKGGAPVIAAKAHLLARLSALGYSVDQDAEAHIVVDGSRIEPIRLSKRRLAFALPAGGRKIVLRSNLFIPAHMVADSEDARQLGICVSQLGIDGETVALADEACAAGWHEAKFADGRFLHRWTTGSTPLPAAARIVIIDLAAVGRYRRARREYVATPQFLRLSAVQMC